MSWKGFCLWIGFDSRCSGSQQARADVVRSPEARLSLSFDCHRPGSQSLASSQRKEPSLNVRAPMSQANSLPANALHSSGRRGSRRSIVSLNC
jgi:hypothetical protein